MGHSQYNLSEMIPVMKRVWAKGGTFSFYPRGTSMQPFLVQGRDKVILSPAPEQIKKYRIVLYQRDNGAYVMHRIVKTAGAVYTMRGDNQYYMETGIRREQILGFVTAVERDGKIRNVETFRELFPVILWVETTRIRRKLNRLRSLLNKRRNVS